MCWQVNVGDSDDLGAKKTGGHDDFFSVMSIESYVDTRTRNTVAYLEKRAPQMAKYSDMIEFTSMLANTSGAILAVLDMAPYVSITVAIGAVAMAISDYFYSAAPRSDPAMAMRAGRADSGPIVSRSWLRQSHHSSPPPTALSSRRTICSSTGTPCLSCSARCAAARHAVRRPSRAASSRCAARRQARRLRCLVMEAVMQRRRGRRGQRREG